MVPFVVRNSFTSSVCKHEAKLGATSREKPKGEEIHVSSFLEVVAWELNPTDGV